MDGWMDGWMDWILLRSLVQLEHLAVLITKIQCNDTERKRLTQQIHRIQRYRDARMQSDDVDSFFKYLVVHFAEAGGFLACSGSF